MDIPFTNTVGIVAIALPFVFFFCSLAFNVRYKKGGYMYGTIANAFLFESVAFSIILSYLVGYQANGWEILTSWPLIIHLWIPLLITPFSILKTNQRYGDKVGFWWFPAYFLFFVAISFVLSICYFSFAKYIVVPVMEIVNTQQ